MRKASDKAVELLQNELGSDYMVSYAGGKYGDVGSITLEILKVGEDGEFESRIELEFKANAILYGLKPEDINAQFRFDIFDTDWYRIIGAKTRNTKYPIIVERVKDNKRFKVPSEKVVQSKNSNDSMGLWKPA